jgi:ADP-heptose:LPS heptosyltransferase
MSSWPKIFLHHPNVNFCYNFNLTPLVDTSKFLNKFSKVHFVEAYDMNFFTTEIHLVNNYRHFLKQTILEHPYNEIYFSQDEENTIKPILSKLEDYVLVQFVGSDEHEADTDFEGSRSLRKDQAQSIIDTLNFDLKLNVLNVFSSKNLFQNTCEVDQNLNYRNYAHLIKYAKGFIAIDSCLNHMSANRFCNTKGVVLWNDHHANYRYNYSKNCNMNTNTPNVMRFNTNDVIDNFNKIYMENKND